KQLILNIQKLNNIVRLSSKKYDQDVLRFFLDKVSNFDATFSDAKKIEELLADFGKWVHGDQKLGITEYKGEVKTSEETGKPYAEIYTVRYADRMITKFGSESLRSSEIIELRKIWNDIQAVTTLPLSILEG